MYAKLTLELPGWTADAYVPTHTHKGAPLDDSLVLKHLEVVAACLYYTAKGDLETDRDAEGPTPRGED